MLELLGLAYANVSDCQGELVTVKAIVRKVSRRRCACMAMGALMILGACGNSDDGDLVREEGTALESGSASGSVSGSASGPAECEPVGDIKTATSQVDVQLAEWTITAPSSVKAGKVGLVAKNIGKEVHELAVLKLDSRDKLPLDAEGGLDEQKLAVGALIGEIEGFPAGESCSGVFDLSPGKYLFACAIVESETGETVSHIKKGMVTEVTVG